MSKSPIQIKSQANGGDTQLATLENNVKMAVILQPLGNFVHHIGLRSQKFVHLPKALLLGLNLKLRAEVVEVLQVERHGPSCVGASGTI